MNCGFECENVNIFRKFMFFLVFCGLPNDLSKQGRSYKHMAYILFFFFDRNIFWKRVLFVKKLIKTLVREIIFHILW